MAAVAVAAFACAGGVASASGGGLGAHGGGTGASLPNPPSLSDVACLEKCAAEHSSIAGGSVALTGRGLAQVSKVTFSGDGAPIVVKPDEVTKTRVVAKVPASAKSGKPKVADRYGQSSKSPVALKVVDESQLPPQNGSRRPATSP